MSNIKKSQNELKNLGVETTYVVAGNNDGTFIILDINPLRFAHNRRKPKILPLCNSRQPVKYASYTDAFNAILDATQSNKNLLPTAKAAAAEI